MKNFYIKKLIHKIESDKRVAVTKKLPLLLIPILEGRRFINSLKYNILDQSFDLDYLKDTKNLKDKSLKSKKLYNITEHSSPLYRKYNKVELDEGKIQNIKIAIDKINGLVLQPNQIFSFWKYVGRVNKSRGFAKGLLLSDGKLIEDYGGGLCQFSNLLAYMFACTECEFVERRHHSRDVFPDSGRSVPFASGATVFYNLIDLKIKNTYDFPIVINLRTTDTQLRGSISSTKLLDYEIKIEERESSFFESKNTAFVYRYNNIYKNFFKKENTKEGISREQIKEEFLWENLAKVIYKKGDIKSEIEIV